jgi:glycine cleavage system H protein
MPDDRTFHMGKFAAVLPGGLRYAPRNHMWCQTIPPLSLGERGRGEGCFRFGFTSYAVRLMQDVYFLDWIVSAGDALHYLQHIGHIETSKAESDLFAPVAGSIIQFNADLLKDPSAINVDKYDAGWLFDMACAADELLDVDQYCQYLADNWENTQRHIKGKINTDDD